MTSKNVNKITCYTTQTNNSLTLGVCAFPSGILPFFSAEASSSEGVHTVKSKSIKSTKLLAWLYILIKDYMERNEL